MRTLAAAAVLAAIGAAPAHAAERSTEAFYQEASALIAKGVGALFSPRVGAVRAEGKKAGDAARAAREAALRRGDPAPYCPPRGGSVGSNEMVTLLGRIPAADRARLPLSQGMVRALAIKWPC